MNWRAIRAIVRKDIKVVVQNKGVVIPIILLPVILFVLVPLVTRFIPTLFAISPDAAAETEQWLAAMPGALQADLAGLNPPQQTVILFLVYMMASLYLIVPIMVSSVIAADSFAGEKERKTLEALLYTPTTDRELLLGKMLSAWLPAVAVAWISFVAYAIVANLAAWPVMGRVFFPTPMWIVLALWVAPALAGLGLATMVLVSVRAEGFQDAYQMGSLIVLPVAMLMIGQATGVVAFNLGLVVVLGLAVWIVDAVLLALGTRTFQRSELIARL